MSKRLPYNNSCFHSIWSSPSLSHFQMRVKSTVHFRKLQIIKTKPLHSLQLREILKLDFHGSSVTFCLLESLIQHIEILSVLGTSESPDSKTLGSLRFLHAVVLLPVMFKFRELSGAGIVLPNIPSLLSLFPGPRHESHRDIPTRAVAGSCHKPARCNLPYASGTSL